MILSVSLFVQVHFLKIYYKNVVKNIPPLFFFLFPFSATPVIVGGPGGETFSFIFDSTIKNFSISYDKVVKYFLAFVVIQLFSTFIFISYLKYIFSICQSERFQVMELTLHNGRMLTYGSVRGNSQAEFVFDNDDKILTAILWPNKNSNRVGGLEFVVEKSNGVKRMFSVKCQQLGDPVCLNVKSGRCSGITGRSGWHIDALGFYFI